MKLTIEMFVYAVITQSKDHLQYRTNNFLICILHMTNSPNITITKTQFARDCCSFWRIIVSEKDCGTTNIHQNI